MSSSTPKVRISLACVACKKRKAKCSGGPPPCQACLASGTNCVIDESLDGRRKAAAKRTYDELTHHKTFIDSLFNYIRTIDKPGLDRLVQLVKADVPWTDIAAVINESLRSPKPNTEPDSAFPECQLDHSTSRHIRRKIEASGNDHGPKRASTTVLDTITSEDQVQEDNAQSIIINFLKDTSHDEVGDIIRTTQGTGARTLYDALRQYVNKFDHRLNKETSKPDMPSSSSTNNEFSRARALSVPNLYEYQQYLQGLFSDYASSDLQSDSFTGTKDRSDWHPALKLSFISSGADSDESNSGEMEQGGDKARVHLDNETSPEFPQADLMSESMPSHENLTRRLVRRPLTNRARRTLQNDPKGSSFDVRHSSISPVSSQSPIPHPGLEHASDMKSNWEQGLANLNLPLYQVLPLTGIDDSPLARSYTSYRDEARSMLLKGVPSFELFGINSLEVNLLFRPRKPSDEHSVCNWASELCGAFRRDLDLSWIMAWTMLLSRFMRWLLIPTEESYNEIPSIMRPTQNQRFIPHNPTADLMVIPALRDALCIRFRDCISPMIHNCRFNWPHPTEEAVEHDPLSDKYVLSGDFERAVLEPTNFIISRQLIDAFPELARRPDVTFDND